jgi:hypothetical protein
LIVAQRADDQIVLTIPSALQSEVAWELQELSHLATVGDQVQFRQYDLLVSAKDGNRLEGLLRGTPGFELRIEVRSASGKSAVDVGRQTVVPFRFGNSNQLLMPSRIDFGRVRGGSTAKRTLIVSAPGNGLPRISSWTVVGSGDVRLRFGEITSAKSVAIDVTFQGHTVGIHEGELILKSPDAALGPSVVRYRAAVF